MQAQRSSSLSVWMLCPINAQRCTAVYKTIQQSNKRQLQMKSSHNSDLKTAERYVAIL
jgi:hypothetical protein